MIIFTANISIINMTPTRSNSIHTKKTVIKGFTFDELKVYFNSIGEPDYRAGQVFNWMYNHLSLGFDEMLNLPKSLRLKLTEETDIQSLIYIDSETSGETGTKKFIFETNDGNKIESVIIPEAKRNTLCISTQVGCPLDCKFCATGLMGYKKNLTAGEIFDQYLLAAKDFGKENLTNIVFMGMGEPLLNYDSTLKSLLIFSEELTTGISIKKITVSTAGIPHRIKDLSDSGLKPKLAFSLHSCFDDIRSKIMPINQKYNLKENIEALKYYTQSTNSRITFEYIMLKGINDTERDLKALIKLCKSIPSKVNIIPFNSLAHMNPTGFSAQLKPTEKSDIEKFVQKLREHDITVIVRFTQGVDIAAACGQLAVKNSTPKISEGAVC